jgi:hypothetical protein
MLVGLDILSSQLYLSDKGPLHSVLFLNWDFCYHQHKITLGLGFKSREEEKKKERKKREKEGKRKERKLRIFLVYWSNKVFF